ncbi:hypothetical protein PybrP1_004009 [[Pythium] brassicae (nom. inval.)]|nr:hypothetical protein PybrP1_004009 [[Pythium] brassicae (nom. inval.)]
MAKSSSSSPDPARRAQQLRVVLQRRALRVWAAKSAQEQQALADAVQQLFSSPTALTGAATSSSHPGAGSAAAGRAAVTRRPGVEEVRGCLLDSACAVVPPSCAPLRGEIWQVLLNVYKRNQHGAAAEEFDRMMLRLGKLPRDPLLVAECAQASALLVTSAVGEPLADARARTQKELELLLVWFLTTKSVEYASGMARVVAPFFLLHLSLPTIYDCFYQYCANFLPRFINTESAADSHAADSLAAGGDGDGDAADDSTGDDANANRDNANNDTKRSSSDSDSGEKGLSATEAERQLLVEQLLSYHDPQLAHCLAQWCGSDWSTPGLIVPASFFVGELYQTLAPQSYTFVMDQILLTGDTLFSVFVLLAALVHARESLLAGAGAADVKAALAAAVARAVEDAETVQLLCLFASRLRSRTPRSFKCLLRDGDGASESPSPSRLATDIAFGVAAKAPAVPTSSSSNSASPPVSASSASDKREAVDMTQWAKKESRSIAGKIFWYHTQTGKTQWEHPAEKFEPAPTLFALPISVDEVGAQVMGERAASDSGERGLHFFVVDCRGLRSSEDLKSGRIPAAYTLDPSVFDSPDLIAKNMEALNPLQSQAHIVLVGHGVGVPPELATTDELKTSIRDAVRLDADAINRAALFFQKRGFRFVSALDGGYASWHAFMRDNAGCSPQELLNHVASECHYCRYDTILRTGEDPAKKKAAPARLFRRKKHAMPTTTDLPVNGGEGDASIISTTSLHNNRPSSASSGLAAAAAAAATSSGNRMSLTLSRSSISSMRTKLADVKIPKLQWGRRSSATSSVASNGNNRHDSGSSSETATVDDGGSDRGSVATDDLEEKADEPDDEGLAALQAKLEAQVSPPRDDGGKDRAFVGVFTIDYSDEEEEEAEADGVADRAAAALPTASA